MLEELSFVKKDKLVESVESCLKNHFESVSSLIVSTFDPKHITECPRRMSYRCKGTNYSNGGVSNREQQGNTNTRLSWGILFRACKGIRVHDIDISVSDCKYNLVGKLDYVIEVEKVIMATKVYSVSDEVFQKIKEKGVIRKDAIEVMVYMWLIELNDGLIIYENRNDFSYTTFHIKSYKPIINSVIKKCKLLEKHNIEGTTPARPYETKNNIECCRCEYENECWVKQQETI